MIKMNIRNVTSVPDESVQDDFVKYVISNCTTKIILSGRWEYNFSRQEYNFSVTGMLGAGKTCVLSELIKKLLRENKKGAKS
ncbi:TPA: DUF2689 domain-containing protein [Salmonella enterica subsp. enterica serovar Bredeney]|uniref:DUF2689 domain-containing protein n=3 Tax=Salmonella enterica TaxID=28901 RepID=A0A5I3EN16_SALET|nr:DUF2689 domain-containing protein [Salmonella enterica]EAA2099743.1 DUF2689 domain-containing protein [Salmonella enterica subsp. enterica serovar Bredeney]EAA7353794.1 DUF2689 domain-containing protein [Salmonella enterica subsp. enterica]EAB7892334.1 DUF2689 domain-containing protein [Salmonella enterica subsp. enterica serovar Newport]EBW5413342.1 DUF2689 domain-containing protein [Salmonella enterica subsp. enterica serovar Bonn]EBY7414793.1 DUF2689 domain-containing protein [Salmonella